MGNKFEVYEYYRDITKSEGYKHHLEYDGESLIEALWIMIKLKRKGAKCLRLDWRPKWMRSDT